MNKFETKPPARGYMHTGEAWYSRVLTDDRVIDEVMIGDYPEGGGTSGEFSIVWEGLCGTPTPQLRAFCDSWGMLAQCRDLIDALSKHDDTNITPKQLCELLDSLGFKDKTQRERPL